MPVPDFQSFLKPLLEIAGDGNEHSMREARERIAVKFGLSEQDLAEKLPSGTQKKFNNRVAWAKSFLVQAKVLDSPRWGYFRITDRGYDLLRQGHDRIDIRVLNQYSEFVEFRTAARENRDETEETGATEDGGATPEEILQQAYNSIKNDLAGELLSRIKNNSPKFFETLVVDLMVAMGYGGSRADAGQSIGQTGDEGVDGLDVIYIQAKRWEGTVGRPEIQRFVGALHGKRARKGVFITTGRFSEDAISYVNTIDPKVILIDGKTLATFMIDFSLGTTVDAIYEIKRVDTDYFAEE
jgi:restriction system protein